MSQVVELVRGGNEPPSTLLTGATGRFGKTLALRLAQAGHRLCLVGRNLAEVEKLRATLPTPPSGEHVALTIDLERAQSGQELGHAVLDRFGVPLHVIHLACPPVINETVLCDTQRLEVMLRVNATALLELSHVLLPAMLPTQRGTIVGLLTEAMKPPLVSGWSTYIVAKTALLGVLNVLAQYTRDANIRVLGLAPGALDYADNPIPAGMTREKQVRMDPQKLADALLHDLENETALANGQYHLCSALRDERGSMATLVEVPPPARRASRSESDPPSSAYDDGPADGLDEESLELLAISFRRALGLPPNADVRDLGTHNVPSWDSLGHLKLVMDVERTLSIKIPASAMAAISSFAFLERAVLDALSA